eukprot:GHUV01029642.1.p1 GENE.GHUV01029642.1~~GHUV01029642.1.p1  ORF type:complete len:154 (+),score=38.92 GHUV01029642.1:191-652(+)
MEKLILNPGFFLLAPLSIAAFCFMVGVGSSDRFIDWPYLWLLFKNISPYFWAVIGVALCVGTSILGAAWGIFVTGSSLVGAAIRVPRITSKNLISIIFCEAVAIYGVIVAIILQTKLEGVTREQGLYSKNNMAAGYAIFGAGLTCGFSNLVCG